MPIVLSCTRVLAFICMQVPYFPPLQTPKDFNEDVCLTIIRAAFGGRPDIDLDLDDVQIRQIRPWTMSAQVASR